MLRAAPPARLQDIDSRRAWLRLAAAFWLITVGAAGMWSVVVALPAVQAEFGANRSTASIPYALTLFGFGIGQVVMGRFTDRIGIFWPLAAGSVLLGLGYVAAGLAGSIWEFSLWQGLLIAFLGSAAMFGPLMADTSLWFQRHRGIAVAICASGNYVGGAIWPPVMQAFIDSDGWRATHIGMGIFCVASMLPVALAMRTRAPGLNLANAAAANATRRFVPPPLDLSPGALQKLLIAAGFGCCMAMAMPQAHLVAYCGDLGYGPARGAEMLTVMLTFGIVSRLGSGWIADRIGALATLFLGSLLQALALFLYVPFDSLWSLYLITALFGLFQGGIIPCYPMIVREYFPPQEAGTRTGIVLLATLTGMAVGGWASGLVFDLTGSYKAAFINGIAWNFLNLAIVGWLLLRARRGRGDRAGAAANALSGRSERGAAT